MNKTKRIAAIGLLCVGASGLSFGETFQQMDSLTWGQTYDASTALFGAVIQQGGANLQSGLPDGTITAGTPLTSNLSEAFALSYDPSKGLASLTIGSDPAHLLDSITGVQTLTIAPAGGTLDHIGIVLSTGASDQTIEISGIQINGADAGSVGLSTGPTFLDFAMAPPTDLSGTPFLLTGNIDMGWTNAPGATLSAEIVGADASGFPTPTPEPGTWALLGSALVGLGLLRRKRIA